MAEEERIWAVDLMVKKLERIEREREQGRLSEEEAARRAREAWSAWLSSGEEDALLMQLVMDQVAGKVAGSVPEDAFQAVLGEARGAWLRGEFRTWLQARRNPEKAGGSR